MLELKFNFSVMAAPYRKDKFAKQRGRIKSLGTTLNTIAIIHIKTTNVRHRLQAWVPRTKAIFGKIVSRTHITPHINTSLLNDKIDILLFMCLDMRDKNLRVKDYDGSSFATV